MRRGPAYSRRAFIVGGTGLLLPFLGACGGGAPGPTGTLHVHLRLSAYERAFFEDTILPDFAHSRGLRVILEEGTTDEVIARIADPQVGIDLITVDTEQLGPLIAANLVQPIDDQRTALTTAPWAAMVPALEQSGKLYALPFRPTTWIAFYNRRLLDAAQIAPPQTWQETLAAAVRLRDTAGAQRLALQGAAGEPAARTLVELIWAFGGDPFAPADGAALAAGEFLAGLGPLLAAFSRDASLASMTAALGSGQTALGPNWPSVAADLLQRGGQPDIAAYPGPAGPGGGPRSLSGQILVVPRHATNRDRALAFAAYLREAATQAALARNLAWIPASPEALTAVPDWQRPLATVAQAALRDARPLRPLARRNAFDTALGDAFRAIAFEGAPPSTALARAAERVRNLQ